MQVQDWKEQIPTDFSNGSKVWIYQSNRPFSEKEQKEINEQLHHFYTQWLSHGAPVKGWAGLMFNQFIVFMADETDTSVSGCSTDSSVRIVKSLERQYSIQLFDRMTISFLVKGKVEMLPFNQLQYAVDKGYINSKTLFFNNTVPTKGDMLDKWLIPLEESWLNGKLRFESVQ